MIIQRCVGTVTTSTIVPTDTLQNDLHDYLNGLINYTVEDISNNHEYNACELFNNEHFLRDLIKK